YPPHGEIGSLFAMVLGPGDRFVGLVQTVAYLVTTVGVVGLARRIGLSPREAVFGGLVFATLPIVVLQASTAQNDLLVASFLVARWLRFGIAVIGRAGARGRDIWLYPLAAVLIAVILVASSAAGRTRRPSVALSAALLLVGSSPLLLRPLARASVHAYASLWL